MKPYRLTRPALDDIEGISARIAADNPAAAVRWLERLNEKFGLLTSQSELGERCDEIRPALRRISFGNYMIYFRDEVNVLEVIRILHGARDVGRAFVE